MVCGSIFVIALRLETKRCFSLEASSYCQYEVKNLPYITCATVRSVGEPEIWDRIEQIKWSSIIDLMVRLKIFPKAERMEIYLQLSGKEKIFVFLSDGIQQTMIIEKEQKEANGYRAFLQNDGQNSVKPSRFLPAISISAVGFFRRRISSGSCN